MSSLVPFNFSTMPAHLQQFALTDVQKAEILSASVPRVTVTNGMLFVNVENQQVIQKRATLHVVVLGENPGPKKSSRAFYLGAWNADAEAVPPDCQSFDGVTPDQGAVRQSESCAACPQNIEGSSRDGKGRACRFTKDLAVVIPELGWDRVFRVRLSAMGIFAAMDATAGTMGYQTFSQLMAKQGLPVSTALVEMGFTEGSNQGMRFKPLGLLDANMTAAVHAPEVLQAATEMLKPRLAAPAPVAPAPLALPPAANFVAAPIVQAPAPVVQAPPPAPVVQAPPPAPVFTGNDVGPAPIVEVRSPPAAMIFEAPAAPAAPVTAAPVLRAAPAAPAPAPKNLNAAVAAAFE